ncbi:zinc knuckle [Ostertagia ostertagi]
MGAKKPKADMSDEEMEQDDQVRFSSDPRIQSEPPLLSESAAITKACDEALSNNIRNLSGPKRAAILNAVEAAVTAVRDEVERPHSEIRDLKEFLSESGLSVPQLRSVLQEAEINLGLIDTLTGVMKCGRAHLADAVISLQQERDHLTHKVTLLQEQVKRYSQPRAAVEERPEEAQGKTFSWRKLSERLISSIEHKDGLNMQVPGESHGKTDGQWKHPSQDLQGGLQDGARKYSLSEKTSESELSFYSEKLEQNDPTSGTNPNHSEMWDIFKAMLKAQTAANVERYTGKTSLNDFLRAFNIKYPQQSWSNHERRDILVSLLDGPAKLMYSNLSRGIQEGSFEDIVEALERARRDPCKKLKKIEEWDRLRKRDCETVEEFCYRMESISREIHSDGDRDFLLGSKLHTCLSDWNDSYHMLTALEAPHGMVYQSVRNAALRLERGREAVRTKLQSHRYQRQDQIDRAKHSGHGKAENGEVVSVDGANGKNVPTRKTKCFKCGEMGHYARNCPNANAQVSPPHSNRQKRKSYEEKPVGSFSAHLEKWCGAVVNENNKEVMTEAYGKPLICRVQMLGMTVDAMVDTGSVVSIVPLGVLLEAKNRRIDLDQLVTIMGDGNSQRVMDASGNTMSFLMLIATEVNVQGAGQACVQLHIQRK